MNIDRRLQRAPVLLLSLLVLSIPACSDHDPATAPTPNAPPILITEAAMADGMRAPLNLRAARMEGRTLYLSVAHGGGCREHTYAALGSTRFSGTDPAELPVYIQHNDDGDRCAAYLLRELVFDVTPAVQLHRATYGERASFYLKLIAPGSEPLYVRVR